MENYIGTKMVKAAPMTRGAYNEYRGWQIPADENPSDEGYLIEYPLAIYHGLPKSNLKMRIVIVWA